MVDHQLIFPHSIHQEENPEQNKQNYMIIKIYIYNVQIYYFRIRTYITKRLCYPREEGNEAKVDQEVIRNC